MSMSALENEERRRKCEEEEAEMAINQMK